MVSFTHLDLSPVLGQSLSMDQLKGDDRRMGSVLAALEAKGAIKVYLAFLERWVYGPICKP